MSDFLKQNYNTLLVLAGTSLLGAAAGLIGAFAVLRRKALLGDALAHAALPGLCVAFLLVGGRHLGAMLVGAFVSGLLGLGVLASIRRFTKVKDDAALGIVLSVFFGVGIVLSRHIQQATMAGSKAGLDSYILGKTAGMIAADLYLIAGAAAALLIVVLLAYKEFRLVSFDPGFAQSQGWPVGRLDLAMMALAAVAVVIGLPTVGVVMIAALLILPSVSARFWTERLGLMLFLSAAFGAAMGFVGTIFSARSAALPAGPIIVLVGAAIFLLSGALAPRRGILARAWRNRRPLEPPPLAEEAAT